MSLSTRLSHMLTIHCCIHVEAADATVASILDDLRRWSKTSRGAWWISGVNLVNVNTTSDHLRRDT